MKLRTQLAIVIGSAFITSASYGDTFEKVGDRACRNANGGGGLNDAYVNISWKACRTKCLENDSCKGIEYSLRPGGKTVCEVHFDQVFPGPKSAKHVISCWKRVN